jgi:hypothetical protein
MPFIPVSSVPDRAARTRRLQPGEVRQRLAEQQAAEDGLVETGECPTRRARPDIRIYERPPFAVIILD